MVKVEDSRFGKLELVPLRELWIREDSDFTPWLHNNIDYLSDALGMSVEIEGAEHPVGPFSLDLIGTNPETGERVIIENQLESTDHSHLGQLLTYAGGTDPTCVIWVASKFREEHRAALDWLNERTNEETKFFGVEVSAVRIGSSPAAPLFKVIASPNNWEKTVRAASSANRSPLSLTYREFWTNLLERIHEVHADSSTWTRSSAGNGDNWQGMATKVKGVGINNTFSTKGLVCELYMNGDDAPELFSSLLAQKELIESELGLSLEWDVQEGRKARKVSAVRSGDVTQRSQWVDYIDWLISTQRRFRSALDKALS